MKYASKLTEKLTEAMPIVGNAEGDYVIYTAQGGGSIMFSRENGRLFRSESEDPASFNPRDAEEVEDTEMTHEIRQTNLKFVKSGRL